MGKDLIGGNMAMIERTIDGCSLASLETKGRIEKAVVMANGIKELRQSISKEMLSEFCQLQNTSLGFRTDKPQGYSPDVVCECIIEAFLRGVNVIGNEFNIIAGRTYITREGFTSLLRKYPGMTDLEINLGVPQTAQGGQGAIVDASAKWMMNGKECAIECKIPVRVNSGMGADAILGKADRKMKARIWARLTGSIVSDGEAGEEPLRTVEATVKEDRKPQGVRLKDKVSPPVFEDHRAGEPEGYVPGSKE